MTLLHSEFQISRMIRLWVKSDHFCCRESVLGVKRRFELQDATLASVAPPDRHIGQHRPRWAPFSAMMTWHTLYAMSSYTRVKTAAHCREEVKLRQWKKNWADSAKFSMFYASLRFHAQVGSPISWHPRKPGWGRVKGGMSKSTFSQGFLQIMLS